MFDRKHIKGMTLVEVIIVVAIIGILAAVAIPSYGWYLEKADLAAAKTGLVSVEQIITKRKLVNNLTGNDVQTALNNIPVDKDISAKYDFSAGCGSNYGTCGNDTIVTYALYATPKAGTGRKKAIWVNDQGAAYLCSFAASAKSRDTSSDCKTY